VPTAVKIWEIVNGSLHPVTSDSFADTHLEKQLETWVTEDPNVLGDRVLIIAQQRSIPGVGRLDLLGIDQSGSLIIIELKRDRTPRDAVAQALDYASWLHSADEGLIAEWAEQYLKQPLKEKFCDYFDVEDFPALSCQRHRIVLVAPRLDASAERIITYLSEQYGVQINAVFFQYARLSEGKEILARALLVPEESSPQPKISKERLNAEELIKMAAGNGTGDLVKICRTVGDWWFEEAVSTFGGSFRYWGQSRAGQDRMVFGVNVAGKAKPPHGQVDVWVPIPSVAEVTGQLEQDVRAALGKQPIADIHMGKNDPCWIRLKTAEEAQALAQQLREFAAEVSASKA
jgi:hypothetical protein